MKWTQKSKYPHFRDSSLGLTDFPLGENHGIRQRSETKINRSQFPSYMDCSIFKDEECEGKKYKLIYLRSSGGS